MLPLAETWRRLWRGRKKFRRPNFLTTFFMRKFSFNRPQFLTTIFSHRLYFVCLLSLQSEILYITYIVFTKNLDFRPKYSFLPPFFSHFILFLTSDNDTSQNIVGTDAWTVPPPQTLGHRPPALPKSPLLNVSITHCIHHQYLTKPTGNVTCRLGSTLLI